MKPQLPALAIAGLTALFVPGCERQNPVQVPQGSRQRPAKTRTVAEVVPPVPAPEREGMLDHAHPIGWSEDGTEFGWCVESDCVAMRRCEFHRPDGSKETLSYNLEADDPDAEAKKTRLEARLAEKNYAVRPVEWTHPDLVLTWTLEHGPGEGPARESRLEAGIGVRSEEDAVLPVKLGPGRFMHPEAVALSPDARHLAVVAHTLIMECGDQFHTAIVPVEPIAAAADRLADPTPE